MRADKRILRPHPKPETHVDPKYRAWVKTLPCAVGGRVPGREIDPHHTGKKSDDRTIVPLARFPYHRQVHDFGRRDCKKREWRGGKQVLVDVFGVDMPKLAEVLFRTYERVGGRQLDDKEFWRLVESCRTTGGD